MTKNEIRAVFIHEITKQYKEHNEPVPSWLSIGGIDFDLDRPTANWLVEDNMWWMCSNCGCRTRIMKKYNVPNYCPACGAKMEKEVEE